MTLTTEPGAARDPHEQASAPASAPSNQRLVSGRYRLIEPLGRGGMGRVYRAHDDLLDRPVAVKLIYDDAVSDRDLRRACAVEARAAARLSHPGVVRILDSGFDDGHCFVVMELAEGQTLSQLIRESGWLPVERALGLAAQMADALEEAHRQGVVHCDVKPGNLIVDPYERVRLVDFGIARVSNSSTGLTDQDIHGSAKYVAPEQVEGGKIDGRTDLYALGVVLFEMLTGRPPFSGGSLAAILAQRLVADPPSVRELQPTIPLDVDQIVRKAMAREPDERYQTAGELRDALRVARDAILDTDRLQLNQVAPAGPAEPWRGAPADRWRAVRPPEIGSRTATIGSGAASMIGRQSGTISQGAASAIGSGAVPIGQGAASAIASGAAAASRRPSEITRQMLALLARALRLAGAWLAHAGRTAGSRVGTILPGPAQPRPVRWPSLPVAIGMVALLGLLTGVAAAQCGLVAGAAEESLAVRPAEASTETLAAPAPATVAAPATIPAEPTVAPTVAPTEAPTSDPVVAPTEPPPPPAPTATTPSAPATATAPPPEPPVAAAPEQRASARPVQALSAPPAAPVTAPAAPAPEATSTDEAASTDDAAPADRPEAAADKPEAADTGEQQPLSDGVKEHNKPTPGHADEKKPEPPTPAGPKPVANHHLPLPNEPRSGPQPRAPQQVTPQAPPKPQPQQQPAPQPAAKPQAQPPAQMKPSGSAPAPAPAAKPSNGNGNGRGNGQGNNGNGSNKKR